MPRTDTEYKLQGTALQYAQCGWLHDPISSARTYTAVTRRWAFASRARIFMAMRCAAIQSRSSSSGNRDSGTKPKQEPIGGSPVNGNLTAGKRNQKDNRKRTRRRCTQSPLPSTHLFNKWPHRHASHRTYTETINLAMSSASPAAFVSWGSR
ncbi:hypothetical protein LY76DRAFT_437138 [Colletotrichum caudatum]|nr:hypothetical protein LY76DRAFT_437138 [Colletotrichum caudatum]